MSKQYTIDRKTWLRGEGSDDSVLLRYDGKMCCLGQILKQCGFNEERLKGLTTTSNVVEVSEVKKVPKFVEVTALGFNLTTNTKLTTDMMIANDDRDYSDEEREAKLKRLAKKYDIELKFV